MTTLNLTSTTDEREGKEPLITLYIDNGVESEVYEFENEHDLNVFIEGMLAKEMFQYDRLPTVVTVPVLNVSAKRKVASTNV